MADEKNAPVEERRLEKEQIEDMGSVYRTKGAHAIHCLTVIGQIEGHVEAPQGQKTTKYEHVIPQLVAVQEDPAVEGLLVLLNTVGGDVEAGLALAELIASISKPSAAVVLGGGHSIGIPLAVSARHSFIVPTATMTVHPVRHSGLILGVPQTMHCFEQMQQRITGFVAAHSHYDRPPGAAFRHDLGCAPDDALVRADAGADHRLRGGPQRHLRRALYRADAPHRRAGHGCGHGAGWPQGRA